MTEPLDALVMELGKLIHADPDEVRSAALIVMNAHSNYHEVSHDSYMELMFPKLVMDLQLKPVVVGRQNGAIVAVYEVPEYFKMEGGVMAFGQSMHERTFPWHEVSYSGDFGAFDTVDRRLETTRAFFTGFGKLLEHLAFLAGVPIIHRDGVAHTKLRLFEAVGYKSVHVSHGLQSDTHIMEKRYERRSYALKPAEAELIDAMYHLMNISLHTVPSNLASLDFGSIQQTI